MNKTSTLTGGSKVKAVPEGMATGTPYLICRDASNAIEFYERAFGAQTLQRLDGPDGRVMHAMIRIGDSNVMLTNSCDTMPDPLSLKGTAVSIHLQVEDAGPSSTVRWRREPRLKCPSRNSSGGTFLALCATRRPPLVDRDPCARRAGR
jgi:hypothetical protein